METLGVIFMTLAVAGGGAFAFSYFKKNAKANPAQIASDDETDYKPSDRIKSTDTRAQIKVAEADQTITLLGDRERRILASVELYEMTQLNPDTSKTWTRTGNVSKLLILAGGIFILKVPSREGGKPEWLKATEIDTFPLQDFYKGTKENPGPARTFARNGQSAPVPYTLPNGLTEGITWEIVDIGRYEARVKGESDNVVNRDFLYFVKSEEKGGSRRLVFLDARQGEARGTGGLLIAEIFEPEVDVKELL